MTRMKAVEISTMQAEAVTLWLYEVDIELGMITRPHLAWNRHLAVLMQYMARGMTPKQAAEEVAELAI